MFGVRLTSLFRSRWMALGWAILICLYAVQFVAGRDGGAPQKTGSGDAAQNQSDAQTAQQVDAILNTLN